MKDLSEKTEAWRLYRFPISLGFISLIFFLLPHHNLAQARERHTSLRQPHHQATHKTSKTSTMSSDLNHSGEVDDKGRRVVYKKKSEVDFDAMLLEGDIKNPNEFYFVHRPEEKFGSLVSKRKNFHKEMLRDTVMIR